MHFGEIGEEMVPSSDGEIRRRRSWCYQGRKDRQDRVEALRDQNALQFWPTQLPCRRVVLTLTSGAIRCSTRCSFFLPSYHPAFSSSSSSSSINFSRENNRKKELETTFSLVVVNFGVTEREGNKNRNHSLSLSLTSLSITEKKRETNLELPQRQYLIDFP